VQVQGGEAERMRTHNAGKRGEKAELPGPSVEKGY
jgi:hypothetical protein